MYRKKWYVATAIIVFLGIVFFILKKISAMNGNVLVEELNFPEGIKEVNRCYADLDKDGKGELLIITGEKDSEYGNTLSIFNKQDKHWQISFSQTFQQLNPWKVQICDVDGDGKIEISLGVYKTAKFHPIMAKRPYIYDWNGRQLVPKWRGSRLSKPFTDFIFVDIDGDEEDEIISIELLSNGQKVINTYNWKGFGFQGAGESQAFWDIQKLERVNNSCIMLGKKKKEDQWERFIISKEDTENIQCRKVEEWKIKVLY